MKLHEYQAKKIFSRYKLPIPNGYICKNINELEKAFYKIKSNQCVLKCQVHSGGRGKAGGIKIINNKNDIKIFANQWFGKMIHTSQTDNNGKIVKKILIEEAYIDIYKELYLSILVDTNNLCITVISSEQGGISIEETSKKTPNNIYKIKIDPFLGPQLYQARFLAYKLNLKKIQINKFIDIFMKLSSMLLDLDLSLVEINPLIITHSNNLICLDGKIVIDNNAKFRQKNIFKLYDKSQENAQESYAKKYGLNYISLNGNIGCLVNGAGLAMSTMDIIKMYGGMPANFLDIGGGIKTKNIIKAFEIILNDKKITALLVNIFGGIVRCDLIAQGIIEAAKKLKINIPVIVRLEGNNAKLGYDILSKNNINIIIESNLNNAVKSVVKAAK